MRHLLTLIVIAATCALTHVARAADKPLIDFGNDQATKRVAPNPADEVTINPATSAKGLSVTIHPGKNDYPGVLIRPSESAWDLSSNGYVEAKVTNTSNAAINIGLRIDNDGDWTTNPWNSENAYPQPGETVTIRLYFGYSWGKPGFKLNPAKVTVAHLFTNKTTVERSFTVKSLTAGGVPGQKPPVNPNDIRNKPANGVIIGAGAKTDSDIQVDAQNASAELTRNSAVQNLRLTFTGKQDGIVSLKPGVGRWDLRDWLQVVVRARNTGSKPAVLKARLNSGSGECPWIATKPIAPGATQAIVLPFAGDVITLNASGKNSGGSAFESDRASAVQFAAGDGATNFVIDSVKAVTPPPAVLPAWLGKRPPVPGNWKQTLAEEFKGPTLNEKLWTIYHPNYWDKNSHISKDDVILKNGMLTLRFEKKRGHENDDPTKPENDYAMGFITSTHKWTQLYGYFESRMKLPHAPGMWPAFWMMPDRGPLAGTAREDTRDGGMEFDILEYLARYGAFRYNIAAHWDGYDKDHKSTGADRIYIQPDKDGFFTAGLLWEPGKLTFYCNGKEVARLSDPRVASVPEYILYTAVSGGWGGNDLTGEQLPSDFVIDYVRVWQKQ